MNCDVVNSSCHFTNHREEYTSIDPPPQSSPRNQVRTGYFVILGGGLIIDGDVTRLSSTLEVSVPETLGLSTYILNLPNMDELFPFNESLFRKDVALSRLGSSTLSTSTYPLAPSPVKMEWSRQLSIEKLISRGMESGFWRPILPEGSMVTWPELEAKQSKTRESL